ncbi:dsRBD fold-containing protein [Actinomycetospora sp. C-140]
MTTTRTWTVTLTFEDDDGGVTWARAVLDSAPDDVLGRGEVLAVEGRAVRWPDHPAVGIIGREAAAARALVALGHQLGDHAFDDAFANAYGRPALGAGPTP